MGALLSGRNINKEIHRILGTKSVLMSERFWDTKGKDQFISLILLVLFKQGTHRPMERTCFGQRGRSALWGAVLTQPSCGVTADVTPQAWSHRRPPLSALWVQCREKRGWGSSALLPWCRCVTAVAGGPQSHDLYPALGLCLPQDPRHLSGLPGAGWGMGCLLCWGRGLEEQPTVPRAPPLPLQPVERFSPRQLSCGKDHRLDLQARGQNTRQWCNRGFCGTGEEPSCCPNSVLSQKLPLKILRR